MGIDDINEEIRKCKKCRLYKPEHMLSRGREISIPNLC
jgi:uracil-DNA glycosylase